MSDYVRELPQRPGLGRHVEHAERSRYFAFRRSQPIETREWLSSIDVLDQGSLGSCTGNAAVGALGYSPFYETLILGGRPAPVLDEALAVAVYSQATEIDAFDGQYPPTDTGSSGLAVAKVLKGMGLISGYLHAFSFIDVLGALMERPLIVGTNWYDGMFSPDRYGEVRPTGPVVGGHEYVVDGWDDQSGRVSCRNSWGPSWGIAGRFYMSATALTQLLNEDGDATVFLPITVPAPEPIPPTPQGCLPWLFGRG